jgi:hypothetical protein
MGRSGAWVEIDRAVSIVSVVPLPPRSPACAFCDSREYVVLGFLPAISNDALKRLGAVVRGWRLHHRVNLTEKELAKAINPIVAGWMQYYGQFYRSKLYRLLTRINAYLMRWVRAKYKRLRARKKAHQAWLRVTKKYPKLFAHWKWTTTMPAVW